jgi:hypothetical protein
VVVLPVPLVVLPAGFGLVPVALVPAPVLGVAPVLSVAVLLSVPLVPVLGVVVLGVVVFGVVVLGVVVLGVVPVDGAVLGGDVVDEVVAPVVGVELVPDVWAAAARAAATSRPRNRKMTLRCMRCSSRSCLEPCRGKRLGGAPVLLRDGHGTTRRVAA